MAFERGIHPSIESRQLKRIFAQQVRPQLGDAGANAFGVGRQVKRPQRADLAIAHDARIGLHAHDGAIEDRDGFPARPFVTAFVQGADRPAMLKCV